MTQNSERVLWKCFLGRIQNASKCDNSNILLERLEGVFSANGNLLTNAAPNASARSSLSTQRSASCILQAKKQEHNYIFSGKINDAFYVFKWVS